MTLVEALLAPASGPEGERFQGTLSDLHIADIQLKCISGATSKLEFTGPKGEKARVYFENGQVRHATAPGKEGREAFNQIVDWKGRESVELLAQEGRVTLVATRDPNLYCEEAPVTLLNVDTGRVEAARAQQKRDGCPLFVTLAQEGLILREPGLQLVHHYGQKLFAQLWTTERVRFVFEQGDCPNIRTTSRDPRTASTNGR